MHTYAFKVHVQVLKFINKNLSGKMIFIKIAIFSKIMMEIFFGKDGVLPSAVLHKNQHHYSYSCEFFEIPEHQLFYA